MATEKKSDAVKLLEKLTGGPLTFARMLRSIRLGDERSLADFAKELGISRQYLCDIEQERRAVSLERAAEWARILGYSERQFMQLALEHQARQAGLDVEITVRSTAKSGRRKAQRSPAPNVHGKRARR